LDQRRLDFSAFLLCCRTLDQRRLDFSAFCSAAELWTSGG
jgi:hypothetical protein